MLTEDGTGHICLPDGNWLGDGNRAVCSFPGCGAHIVRDHISAPWKKALCGYVAIYQRQRIPIYAESLYAAKREAIRLMKIPLKKQNTISVILCERADGSQVIHSTPGI